VFRRSPALASRLGLQALVADQEDGWQAV